MIFDSKDIKRILNYSPITGKFTQCDNAGLHKIYIFEVSRKTNKYVQISVDKDMCYAHRLAWLYVYGYWPQQIDHIDGDGLNNEISNLREVSDQENKKNLPVRCDNSSGVVGVYYDKARDLWAAQINIDKKTVGLGRYDEKNEAIIARLNAEDENGYSHRANFLVRKQLIGELKNDKSLC